MWIAILSGVVLAGAEAVRGQRDAADPALTAHHAAVMRQTSQAFHGPDLTGKDGPLHKIGFDLTLLHTSFKPLLTRRGRLATFQSDVPLLPLVQRKGGLFVTLDAIAADDVNRLYTDLIALGLQNPATFGRVVSGQFPLAALERLAALPSLRFARPAIALTQQGAVVGQADIALTADRVRQQFAIDGTGVTVGVLSDSYNCLDGAAADVASGELPSDILVLAEEEDCAHGKDEGQRLNAVDRRIRAGRQASLSHRLGRTSELCQGDSQIGRTRRRLTSWSMMSVTWLSRCFKTALLRKRRSGCERLVCSTSLPLAIWAGRRMKAPLCSGQCALHPFGQWGPT